MTTQGKVALDHAACVYSTKEEAKRTLEDCLGLKPLRDFTLDADLADQLFRMEGSMEVVAFGSDKRLLEAFIVPSAEQPIAPGHVCLRAVDLASTLDRCRDRGLEVRQVWVKDHDVFFVRDGAGNLFELKQG